MRQQIFDFGGIKEGHRPQNLFATNQKQMEQQSLQALLSESKNRTPNKCNVQHRADLLPLYVLTWLLPQVAKCCGQSDQQPYQDCILFILPVKVWNGNSCTSCCQTGLVSCSTYIMILARVLKQGNQLLTHSKVTSFSLLGLCQGPLATKCYSVVRAISLICFACQKHGKA